MLGTEQDTVIPRRDWPSWASVTTHKSSWECASCRILLAVVLLAAALLKGYQLVTGPVLGDRFFDSRPFLIVLVEFEWLFGVWMVSGLYARRAWQVALACFSAFAGVSLYKGLAGDASCGCFGRVEISPWYTLALDLAAVVALLRWPRRDRAPGDEPNPAHVKRLRGVLRVGVVVAVALFVGIAGVLAMATYHPAMLSEDGMIVGPGDVVVLEPEKWVSKRFPLLDYIDIGGQLTYGNWLVVVYRYDCPECQELLPRYVELARRWRTSQDRPRIALVEVPPYGAGAGYLARSVCTLGRVDTKKDWFVGTPLEVVLQEGITREVVAAGEEGRMMVDRALSR